VTRLVLSVLLAALAGFAYLNALNNPFVYDDQWTVLGNPTLRAPGDVSALLRYSPFRPALNATYALDHAVWGARPFGFHLTSVLLHMVNVALVFWVAVRVIEDRRRDDDTTAVAGLAALAFAVHPVMTQAVGYVSGRSEVLCATFFLSGLLALRAEWSVAALVLTLAAAASKETGVMLPFVFLVWDRVLLSHEPRRRWVPITLAGLVVLLAIVRLTVFVGVEPPTTTRWSDYIAAQGRGIWQYLVVLAAPLRQSLVHGIEPQAEIGVTAIAGALGLLAVIVCAVLVRRRAPVVTVGIAWFLLVLVPASIVPLEEVIAEQRVYLASVGVFLAVGAGIAWLARRSRVWRAGVATACVLALASLATLTVMRNTTWANAVTLWTDAATKAPGSWRAHYGLGNALGESGDCRAAAPELAKAAALSARPEIFMNLATCYAAEKRMEEAATAYRAALAVNPRYLPAHFNLALLAVGAGDRTAAHRHFLDAVPTDDLDPVWREFLVRSYMTVMSDPVTTLEMCERLKRIASYTVGLDECFKRAGR
jgi:Tfp pilus assembly protein PilF